MCYSLLIPLKELIFKKKSKLKNNVLVELDKHCDFSKFLLMKQF